ncbi:MAG: right-handed parallel beta-helix repeat-containing protein, partial [Planctomycetota bacterium]
MRFILTLGLFLLLAPLGSAEIIYVPDDHGTIQEAIDQAVNGDTIIVRPGTYVENLDYSGKEIAIQSEQGPESTVIDGNQDGSVVVFQNGEGPAAVLEGFTITNGNGTVSPQYGWREGGGIWCAYESSPIIRKNIITGNKARYGGGIFTVWSLEIRENIISENTANGEGAGIFTANSGDLNIVGNLVIGNTATFWGGGIELAQGSYGLIESNIITGNIVKSGGSGGILIAVDCIATIRNNLIFDNQASSKGGGIDLYSGSTAMVVNNTLFNNSANRGGGIACRTDSFVEIT